MLAKKILFCFGLLFCQVIHAQFTYGFSAGINLANLREKINNQMITNSFLPRLNAGMDLGYFFNRNWGIQSGIYYAGKGYRIKLYDNFDSTIVRLNYLEVPLKLSYRIQGDEDNWIIVSTGVYGAYGYKGKITFTGSPERTKDPFKDPGYNRFDFGYVIESAFGIKGNFSAKLVYTHGFISLRDPEDKMKNFLFNFSLAYSIK